MLEADLRKLSYLVVGNESGGSVYKSFSEVTAADFDVRRIIGASVEPKIDGASKVEPKVEPKVESKPFGGGAEFGTKSVMDDE